MKKLVVLTVLFILSQIFTINICLGNSVDQSAILSGSAWMDNNRNAIQELNEAYLADVVVFVKNIETDKLITTKTDADGNFIVTDLAYGRYNVWSENTRGAATPTQIIELDEVNGIAVLDFVFMLVDFNIFLPMIMN